jgi:hypothetical protein
VMIVIEAVRRGETTDLVETFGREAVLGRWHARQA